MSQTTEIEIPIRPVVTNMTNDDTTAVNNNSGQPSEAIVITTTTITTETPTSKTVETIEKSSDSKKTTTTTITTSATPTNLLNGENDKMDRDADLINFKVLYVLTQLCGLTLIVLMGIWVGAYMGGTDWRDEPKQEFYWHPILMTIGLIYLYGNGILVYRGFRNCRKKTLKLTHAAIHMSAFILTVIALVAAFDSHNLVNPPIANMYTLHSWLGLSAVLLFCLQYVGGFVMFLVPGAKESLKIAMMPLHIYFGLFGFVLALASALMGLTEKAIFSIKSYNMLPPAGVIVNIMGVLFVIFGGLVVYLATERGYKRQPIPEDTQLLTGSNE